MAGGMTGQSNSSNGRMVKIVCWVEIRKKWRDVN